jgi:dolichol-phosphate mannosyltransferase
VTEAELHDRLQATRQAQVEGCAISVIMPAHNLETQIVSSVEKARKVLEEISPDYEVVVVDDGSSDSTSSEVSSIRDERVTFVRNHVNQGKGYSVKRAVRVTRGQYVIMLDADNDLNYGKLKRYLSLLDNNDIVIASKRHPRAVYQAPLSRKFLSLAFNALVRLLTGVNRSDTQAGVKAFKGDVLKRVMKFVLVKRYAFDVEMLVVANLLGLKVAEVPVTVRQSRRFSVKGVMYMLIDLLGIAYRLRIVRWYQKSLTSLNPDYKPLLRM